MSETMSSVQARLLSDAYWEGPVQTPVASMSPGERLEYFANQSVIFEDHAKAHEIGNVVLSLHSGGTYQEIPEGMDIPLPLENPRQVVKIVRESRTFVPWIGQKAPRHKFDRALSRALRRHGSYTFELIAGVMDNQQVYMGPVAVVAAREFGGTTYIAKEVNYLRGSGYEGLGAIIATSDFTADDVREGAHPLPLPRLTVGGILQESKHEASKIASAALIEANSVRWTHGGTGGGANKKKARRSASWVPAFRST